MRASPLTKGVTVGRLHVFVTADFLAMAVGWMAPLGQVKFHTLDFEWHEQRIDRLKVRGIVSTKAFKPGKNPRAAAPRDADDADDVDWGAALRPKKRQRRRSRPSHPAPTGGGSVDASAEQDVCARTHARQRHEVSDHEDPCEADRSP